MSMKILNPEILYILCLNRSSLTSSPIIMFLTRNRAMSSDDTAASDDSTCFFLDLPQLSSLPLAK